MTLATYDFFGLMLSVGTYTQYTEAKSIFAICKWLRGQRLFQQSERLARFLPCRYDDAQRKTGSMANTEHLSILKDGLEAWSVWRRVHDKINPDLIGADLSGASFIHADFSGADLQEAFFRDTVLRGAHFDKALLRWSDLKEVDLGEVNLAGAHIF